MTPGETLEKLKCDSSKSSAAPSPVPTGAAAKDCGVVKKEADVKEEQNEESKEEKKVLCAACSKCDEDLLWNNFTVY